MSYKRRERVWSLTWSEVGRWHGHANLVPDCVLCRFINKEVDTFEVSEVLRMGGFDVLDRGRAHVNVVCSSSDLDGYGRFPRLYKCVRESYSVVTHLKK
jgi:hypothetical protein